MRIHHLNCGSFCPHASRLITGKGGLFSKGLMVCHCVLLETDRDGLILIDTGIGTRDCTQANKWPVGMRSVSRPRLDLNETAAYQLKNLGFDPSDVRHIIVTHLDLDHAGGLADFPHAVVHVHATEQARAMNPATAIERRRYLSSQWSHRPTWEAYSEFGDTWFGLQAVHLLRGVSCDLALVPLVGHTEGHTGIAIQGDNGWMIHAGDAYFHKGQIEHPPSCPKLLEFFQKSIATNDQMRRENLARLRQLNSEESDNLQIFCAHDPDEFFRLSKRSAS